MSILIVKRNARRQGPPPPEGEVELAQPPVMPEPADGDIQSRLGYLPMVVAGGLRRPT